MRSCIHRTSQRCACSSTHSCLLSGSCTSVQTFVVPLTSVHPSRKTTLRLTNVSGTNRHIRDLNPLALRNFSYIYHSRHTQIVCAISLPTWATRTAQTIIVMHKAKKTTSKQQNDQTDQKNLKFGSETKNIHRHVSFWGLL